MRRVKLIVLALLVLGAVAQSQRTARAIKTTYLGTHTVAITCHDGTQPKVTHQHEEVLEVGCPQ